MLLFWLLEEQPPKGLLESIRALFGSPQVSETPSLSQLQLQLQLMQTTRISQSPRVASHDATT